MLSPLAIGLALAMQAIRAVERQRCLKGSDEAVQVGTAMYGRFTAKGTTDVGEAVSAAQLRPHLALLHLSKVGGAVTRGRCAGTVLQGPLLGWGSRPRAGAHRQPGPL